MALMGQSPGANVTGNRDRCHGGERKESVPCGESSHQAKLLLIISRFRREEDAERVVCRVYRCDGAGQRGASSPPRVRQLPALPESARGRGATTAGTRWLPAAWGAMFAVRQVVLDEARTCHPPLQAQAVGRQLTSADEP